MSEWKKDILKMCENCQALEIELGLKKNTINELTAELADYRQRWPELKSELETLRMWRATVLRAAGVTEK